MIILTVKKTTGKEVISIIEAAIEEHSKKTKVNVSIQDFCTVADISRQQIHAYRTGLNDPQWEGLAKIAAGLRAWGNEVTINI